MATTRLPFLLFLQHILATPLPQTGDGGGTSSSIPDGSLGYDPSAEGDARPGSSGADSGGVRLGKGAIIAISVVAGVIVIAGITMAILFWGAKKRQWAVAETMRRSVRRVATGLKEVMTPRTPHKMTFSPIEKQRPGSWEDGLGGSKGNKMGKSNGWVGNTEKGPTTYMASVVGPGGGGASRAGDVGGERQGKKQRPVPPRVMVPKSKFEMESPKTPMWNRVFGR